jgi:oligopeptide transport system substrate-binding protein
MRYLNIIGGLAALVCIAACGADPADGGDDLRTLHRGNDAEPLTLDPHKITMAREFEILSDLFAGLYQIGPDGNPLPGLAERTEISGDGLTWTFTLRGAHWSDGAPITAQDAVFGIQRSLDPATLNSLAIALFMIENAAEANAGEVPLDQIGAVALDDRTVQLTLAYQAPYLPEILAAYGFPAPRHAVDSLGQDWVRPGTMVSSGPYVLSQWRSNNFVRLERNPRFYGAPDVCFDTVIYYPTTDRQAAERRIRAGELDLNVEIGPGSLAFLEENHPDLLRRSPSLRANDLIFNTQRPPFDDIRVRQALSMAIDRRFLANEVTRGVKRPSWRLMSTLVPSADPEIGVAYRDEPMEMRRAQARALLESAGFGPDNPLRFTLRIHPGFPLGGPVLQQDWAEIAPWVSAELLQNDIQLHYESARSGDFDVAYASWTPDFTDPYAVLFRWEASAGDLNYSRWTNAEFEALLTAANQERDPQARLGLLSQAERLLTDSHAHAPLTEDVSFDLVQPGITGWVTNPRGQNPSRWLCREGLEPRAE